MLNAPPSVIVHPRSSGYNLVFHASPRFYPNHPGRKSDVSSLKRPRTCQTPFKSLYSSAARFSLIQNHSFQHVPATVLKVPGGFPRVIRFSFYDVHSLRPRLPVCPGAHCQGGGSSIVYLTRDNKNKPFPRNFSSLPTPKNIAYVNNLRRSIFAKIYISS